MKESVVVRPRVAQGFARIKDESMWLRESIGDDDAVGGVVLETLLLKALDF